jgi:chemotaxis protein methyltransferase CheR
VKARTGLDLGQYKPNQLQRRILGMAESKQHRTLSEFSEWVLSSKENTAWYLDRLAINVSELFRNPEKWEELRVKILPWLLSRSARLKCWSAGCSYGAEAYTLAMILDRHFPGAHKIVGTDIDQAALAQAKEGRFSEADVKGVPPDYRKAYLYQSEGVWKADPKLAKLLEFKAQNLLADRFDTGFDLVLCRNVVIYFTDEAKDSLYRRIWQSLKPGGVLFVGSTERLSKAQETGYESMIPFFYRKPILGGETWRSAS